MGEFVKFSELTGKTIVNIDGLEIGSGKVVFETDDGYIYVMFHPQECCETVEIEDVNGYFKDLLNTPIIIAEEREGEVKDTDYGDEKYTFYTLATIKGYVDIRWYGASNGYYSIGVYLGRIKKEENIYYYFNRYYSYCDFM